MDDLFKIDINSPVPEFSYLPFINLIPLIAAAMSGQNKLSFIQQSSFTPFRMTPAQRFKKINYNQSQMSSRNLPFSR
jgi:hypothetical protein